VVITVYLLGVKIILFICCLFIYLYGMAKETKRSLTYSGYESTKRKAAAKAKKEGRALSDVIEGLLQLYLEAPMWKYVADGKTVPFSLPNDKQ